MKEIQKVVQKLLRGQESAAGVGVWTEHKVTPGIPGWLNQMVFIMGIP